jgi:hypothetical protein
MHKIATLPCPLCDDNGEVYVSEWPEHYSDEGNMFMYSCSCGWDLDAWSMTDLKEKLYNG